jgi:hypothetical protein
MKNYSSNRSFLPTGAIALCAWLAVAIAPEFAAGQTLQALTSNGAGAISAVASAQVGQDQFVTAVRNGAGNLEVISWYFDAGANPNLALDPLVRQGTNYGGPILGGNTSIAITSGYSLYSATDPLITATVNADGYLDLIYWQLQPNGAISYVSEYVADTASAVSVAAVYGLDGPPTGQAQFMTATRNAWGNLEVSLWYIDSNNQIQLVGTDSAGAVSEVSIVCVQDSSSDVITAVRNSSGNLELIQWHYADSEVSRGNTWYGTAGSQIAAAAVAEPFSGLINLYTADLVPSTAFPQGQLNVAWWDTQGSSLSTGNDTTIPSTQVALTSANTAALAVGVLGASGPYVVDVFDYTADVCQDEYAPWGGEVAAAYGSPASALSISPVDTRYDISTVFAVSYRNSSGNLQIQLWQYLGHPC